VPSAVDHEYRQVVLAPATASLAGSRGAGGVRPDDDEFVHHGLRLERFAEPGTEPVASDGVEPAEKVQVISDNLAINPLNAKELISAFGLAGIWAILFAETGLLLGFFLPGDSLLFLAGVFATDFGAKTVGQLSLPGLLIGAPIFAIVGAQLGHLLGARYGRRLFDRPNSRLFKREFVDKAEHYFLKFGPAKAVVLARFIPIVRTFLNPVAGVLGMPARTFFLWNVVGAILWTDGIILIGYLLGDQLSANFPIDKYLLPAIVTVVGLSVLPIAIEFVRERRRKRTPVG
jgi:membrane-associated protein